MKKLGSISKNIISILLVFTIALVVDLILNEFFFSAAAGSLAVAPTLLNLSKTAQCNMAGVSTKYFVIPLEDIESFPTFNAQTTPADTALYIGDFTLKAGKYWYEMYNTKEKGNILAETDGATDGKFFRNSATGFFPRLNKEGLGLANVLKDLDCIVIMQDLSGGGQYMVVGSEAIPVTVSPSMDSGTAFSDEKGITFLFEAAGCRMPVIYEGEIITELGAVQSPTTMAIDATSVDLSVNHRFEVGANTGAIVLATINNMVQGDSFRIDYVGTSTGSLSYSGAFGATALIDTTGEWFQVKKDSNNNLVIVAGSFS